nr:DUF4352 domain-containing protein [Eubacterium sp.]
MRKSAIALALCTSLFITGCSSDQVTETLNKAADQVATMTETTAAPVATPAPTPASTETEMKLGKKGTVGNWDIKVKKAEVKKKIKNGSYRYFDPGKGNRFVVVSVSAKNNGEEAEQFLPLMGFEGKMVTAVLIDESGEEYKATQLIAYSKDLTTRSIKPNKTESGVVAFQVPKKAAKSLKKLTLKIGTSNDALVYTLK